MHFDQIWIDKDALLYPVTHSIIERLSGVSADVVEDVRHLKYPSDPLKAKRQLVLTTHKGVSFKPCQGLCEGVVCCGYHTIDLGSGCPCDCSYCILQHYLANNPMTTIYVNIEQILMSVRERLDNNQGQHFRIGTGELADSLAYDDITGYSKIIVPFFAQQRNATFEFKTKTTNIANLLGLKHSGRVVVSWSLNPPSIIESDEKGAASLDERLAAAARCVQFGYRVGFHFDPMINYNGWEADYRGVVEKLFKAVPAASVAWISLGALRFPQNLKAIAEKRFPATRIFTGEFVPANGKMRYFRPIREEMYLKMRGWIREFAPSVSPYLCMETESVSERYLGSSAV